MAPWQEALPQQMEIDTEITEASEHVVATTIGEFHHDFLAAHGERRGAGSPDRSAEKV